MSVFPVSGPAAGQIYAEAMGKGPAVVLIHGLAGSGQWWDANLPALAAQYRVYVVDMVGFGRSRRLGQFVLHDAAATLGRWMDDVGIGRAHLVGHSLGALVAAELAADRPESVDHLVLVDAAVFPYYDGSMVGLGWSLMYGRNRMPARFRARLAADVWRAGPRSLARATRDMLRADLRPKLAQIEAPCLLIWGAEDRLIPRTVGERLAEALPKAKLVTVPGAGHNPMWEKPEVFNRLLLEFFAEGSTSSVE